MIAAAGIISLIVHALLATQRLHGPCTTGPLSAPVLKQRLALAQTRLWAWEVEYETPREERPGVPAKSYVHKIVAAKAPDLFFHWSAHGTPWLDWRDDPYQQRLTLTSGKMFSERPLDRCFIERQMRPEMPLPGSAPHELLFEALGWWPFPQRPPPVLMNKLPASLSAIVQSSEYKARPSLELAGGRWCQVLECPGRDQLWLDVDRGCAVVTRQVSDSVRAQVHRVECADFREILPGVWVPFTIHNLFYERKLNGGLGRRVLDGMLHVQQVRLNAAVEDSRFRFKPLPGSVVDMDGQPVRQVASGGEEYLDEVAEWICRYVQHRDAPTGQIGWADVTDMALGALLAGVVVTALLLWWWGWSGTQNRSVRSGLVAKEKKERLLGKAAGEEAQFSAPCWEPPVADEGCSC